MSRISLQHIYKAYNKNNMVIKDLSLEIFDNEFIVIVGPSGCGKTTVLRMIAGLEEITKGNFYIDDICQNDLDPSSRNLSFVFQNYALFPNLTIYQNIEFGLLNKKMTKLEKSLAVETIAKKLSLYEKLGNYPHQLSGGQRQRVALARALVDEQHLVLFDEPLSNLDAVLRAEMRTELIRIQNQSEVTGVYVTHDQIEAMTMASRIALMIDGRIIQVGLPEQMYHNPNSLDVACFIGTPEINVISARFDGMKMVTENNSFEVNDEIKNLLEKRINEEIYYTIRPQDVKVSTVPTLNSLVGEVEIVEYFGYNKLLHVDVNGMKIRAMVASEDEFLDKVFLDLSKTGFVFDSEKRRIHNQKYKTLVLKDVNQLSAIDEQAIRELKNYGYQIKTEEDDIPNDCYIIKQRNDKKFEIKGLDLEVSSLKELLNYLSDIRKN